MILAGFISQLRAYAPVFEGRVAGAAEFEGGLRNYTTSLPLPAAYVVPLAQEAEPNDSYGGLFQIVHMGIGVIVELDAQTDRRGQAPAMNIDDIRAQVFASVLNFKLDDCHMVRGAWYSGARPLSGLDRARWFYQFEFNVDWQITDADGFNVDGIPIEALDLYGFLRPKPGDEQAWKARIIPDPDNPPTEPPEDITWPEPATTE